MSLLDNLDWLLPDQLPSSSVTAATAWACVGTGPMTAEPWGLLMLEFPCRKLRLRSLHLSPQRTKTSAACLCLSGDEQFEYMNGFFETRTGNICDVVSAVEDVLRIFFLIVCAERADVLWLPRSVSSDTWPCTASFSSAPSSSSTRWVKALWQKHFSV